jgi:[protein-PII] uridylyltransferase
MLVDGTLKDIWRHLTMPSGAALVAVGGYGRGELFPHSDVDILVLLPHSPSTELARKLEELIGYFWDTGLEVAHSVRTLAECIEEAKKDITVQTSLTEARLIVGGRALFSRFRDATLSAVVPLTFFNAKRL